MKDIGCIKVDVAMSDAAYYDHAPHDIITLPMALDDLQKVIDKVTRYGAHGYVVEDIQATGEFGKLHFAEDENVNLRSLNAMAECVKESRHRLRCRPRLLRQLRCAGRPAHGRQCHHAGRGDAVRGLFGRYR